MIDTPGVFFSFEAPSVELLSVLRIQRVFSWLYYTRYKFGNL